MKFLLSVEPFTTLVKLSIELERSSYHHPIIRQCKDARHKQGPRHDQVWGPWRALEWGETEGLQ